MRFQLIAILLLSFLIHANLLARENGRQVIFGETLRKAGVVRLGEILQLSADWYTGSLDGFIYQAASGGLGNFSGENWEILLDGIPLNLRLIDNKDMNLLPVSIHEIDSVEIFSSAQIQEGVFNDRGIIHLHTRQPAPGIHTQINGWIGNETGDPGPLVFLDRSLRNVDRIGPDYTFELTGRFAGWHFRLGALEQNQYFTYPAARERNRRRNNDYLRMQTGAPALRMGYLGEKIKVNLFAGYTTSSGNYPDSLGGAAPLLFLPYRGELPTDRQYTITTLSGDYKYHKNGEISAQLGYDDLALGENQNFPGGFNLNWEMRHWQGGLTNRYRKGNLHMKQGVSWRRYRSDQSSRVAQNALTFYQATIQFRWQQQEKIRQLETLFLKGPNNLAVKSALFFQMPAGEQQIISLRATFAQRLFSEDNNLWFWTMRGYDLLNRLEIPYRFSGKPGKSAMLTLDGAWQYHFGDTQGLYVNLGVYHHNGIYIPEQSFRDDPEGRLPGPLNINHNENGTLLRSQFRWQNTPWRFVRQSVVYNFQTPASGSAVFRKTQDRVPKHWLRYTLDWQPVKHFSIWGAVNFQSETRWHGYSESTIGRTQNLSSLPARWLCDLAFRKEIWEGRLSGSLVFRNLFDGREQYHPYGIESSLRFYAHFQVKL